MLFKIVFQDEEVEELRVQTWMVAENGGAGVGMESKFCSKDLNSM